MSTETKAELEIVKIKKEIEKIDSENEKIKLESKELRKSIWKKPHWLAFLTTLTISIGTLLTLLLNGTFGGIRIKTEADVSLLKLEKKEFENERDRLDTLIKQKADSLGIIIDGLAEMRAKNNSLTIENSNLAKINRQLKTGMNKVIVGLLDSTKQLNTKLLAATQINQIRVSEKEFTISSGTPRINSVVKLIPDLKNKIIDIGIEGETIIEKVSVVIQDFRDRRIYTGEFKKNDNKINFPIDISRFPKGKYALRIVFSGGGGKIVNIDLY